MYIYTCVCSKSAYCFILIIYSEYRNMFNLVILIYSSKILVFSTADIKYESCIYTA